MTIGSVVVVVPTVTDLRIVVPSTARVPAPVILVTPEIVVAVPYISLVINCTPVAIEMVLRGRVVPTATPTRVLVPDTVNWGVPPAALIEPPIMVTPLIVRVMPAIVILRGLVDVVPTVNVFNVTAPVTAIVPGPSIAVEVTIAPLKVKVTPEFTSIPIRDMLTLV